MAAGRIEVGSAIPLEDHGARVAAVASRHERTLLRVARQASLCEDDAHDAYQRALEIFVRRVATVDPRTELAWLKVVVRHEALAIRRTRSESVTGEQLDFDTLEPGTQRSVEDQIASGERVRRSAEALRALKPDEARALMMKAQGLSYEEIGRRNGWSYTKVNRAVTEGRKRFLRAYAGIESGAECDRFAPIVTALAEGSATSAQVLEIRPHLRNYAACRATVRDLRLSRLRRASLFWPLFGVVEPFHRLFERSPEPADDELELLATPDGTLIPMLDGLAAPIPEPLDLPDTLDGPAGPTLEALDLPDTLDGPVAPAPDVLDLPDTLDGPTAPMPDRLDLPDGLQPPTTPDGLMPVEELADTGGRIAALKHDIAALLHRANASDVATGVHIATGTGGGRVATIGTVIGLCLSSLTAGTACVVTGVLPGPSAIFRSVETTDRSSSGRRHPRDDADVRRPTERPAQRSYRAAAIEPQPVHGAPHRSVAAQARSREGSLSRPDQARRERRRPAEAEFGFESAVREPQSVATPSPPPSAEPPPATAAGHSPNPTSTDAVQHEFDPAQQEFRP